MSLAAPKQIVSHPACSFMRHSINKMRAELCQIYWLGSNWTPLLPAKGWVTRSTFPFQLWTAPIFPGGLQWFIVWGRPCEKLCLFCLLSYQLWSYNGPGVLTILPSGERRLWPGSRLAGETCCKTDWLVTMALLPWWLIVEEEVTSLVPCWL